MGQYLEGQGKVVLDVGDVTLSYARENALEEREGLVLGEQGESR